MPNLRAKRVLIVLMAAAAAAALSLSGDDPSSRTPAASPGLPEPFLGIAPVSNGRFLAVVDAYGSVVEARYPGPAGPALIENPRERQEAGTVDPSTGITVRAGRTAGTLRPLWGTKVISRYRRGTNVLVTRARLGRVRVRIVDAVDPRRPVLIRRVVASSTSGHAAVQVAIGRAPGLRCRGPRRAQARRRTAVASLTLRCTPASEVVRRGDGDLGGVERSDRAWISASRPLGLEAPLWARGAYERSLLVLRALVDRRTGAVPAAPRDHWHHVWPRDAALVAIALAESGHAGDARRVARFLLALPFEKAARFGPTGRPVAGRPAAGDGAGWIAAAARATGLPVPSALRDFRWRDRDDWWENGAGVRLGNAIAAGASAQEVIEAFGSDAGLRHAPALDSGLDSAAAWAIVPFRHPDLRDAARATLLTLANSAQRFGIKPGSRWSGPEPWTAPTAWTAWALAELGEIRAADGLIAALRRAATPAGTLPERVDPRTGVATSATPLAWSHAAYALALLARYPR